MPTDDLARYKPLFLQTAWDYLRQLESSLSVLSVTPTDKEAWESVHIAAHSLKSQCSVMNYNYLAATCHRIEIGFKQIIEGSRVLTTADVTMLQEVVTGIKESLSQISVENTEKNMTQEQVLLDTNQWKGEQL